MKKLLLTLLSITALLISSSAVIPPQTTNTMDLGGVIIIKRTGSFTGFFNLYKKVEITYLANGNIYVLCKGNGFKRCRLVFNSPEVPTTIYDPNAEAIEFVINSMLDDVETQASNGKLDGSASKIIAIADANSQTRGQIVNYLFKAIWSFEKDESGDGVIEISYTKTKGLMGSTN